MLSGLAMSRFKELLLALPVKEGDVKVALQSTTFFSMSIICSRSSEQCMIYIHRSRSWLATEHKEAAAWTCMAGC